jgi:hypothetical protein
LFNFKAAGIETFDFGGLRDADSKNQNHFGGSPLLKDSQGSKKFM